MKEIKKNFRPFGKEISDIERLMLMKLKKHLKVKFLLQIIKLIKIKYLF